MKVPHRSAIPVCLLLLCLAFCDAACARAESQGKAASFARILSASRTPLDEYVAAPDSNFEFHQVKTIPGQGQTTYVLEMTSQAWLTTNEVDRPLWKHWVIIVKPDEVKSSKSLLFIIGGWQPCQNRDGDEGSRCGFEDGSESAAGVCRRNRGSQGRLIDCLHVG